MMSTLWWMQAVLIFMEFVGAFWCVWVLTGVNMRSDLGKTGLLIGNCVMAVTKIYQRSIYMYSHWYIVLSVICCGLLGVACFKEHRKNTWFVFWIYFETLYCLDLFLYILTSALWNEKDLMQKIYLNLSVERLIIYMISRCILVMIIMCIYRKKDTIRNYILTNRWILMTIPIIEHVSLYVCDDILLPDKKEKAIRNWKVVLGLYSFLVMVIILFFSLQKYKLMCQKLKYQNQLYIQWYEIRRKNTQEKEQVYHDIKNHLLVMKKMIQDGDFSNIEIYMDKLVSPIILEDVGVITGQPIVDYLLWEKRLEARQNNIQVIIVCEGFRLQISNNELSDWCALLGNLWDNAIEECKRVKESVWIRFSLKQVGNVIVIVMENSCHMNLNLKQLHTLKTDKKRHGIGMQSIRYVVNRYQGTMEWSCKDCIFKMRITLLL